MSRIRHEHSGYFGPPPLHCPCCGTKESQSGCVRGFPCTCKWDYCYVCHKCVLHCACPGGPERDMGRAHEKLLAKLQQEEVPPDK